jgi:hypothetical protein
MHSPCQDASLYSVCCAHNSTVQVGMDGILLVGAIWKILCEMLSRPIHQLIYLLYELQKAGLD